MTTVSWLLQTAADLPPHPEWLSPAEHERLAGLEVSKRRQEWLLGRWTAKRALAVYRPETLGKRPLSHLEIRTAADGAPEAACDGQALPLVLTLSHRSDLAVSAVAETDTALGCDLEKLEPRSEGLVEDFFTEREQALVAAAGAEEAELLANLVWSAKESALKAMRVGLRMDTRKVEVELPARDGVDGWCPVRVHHQESGREFVGWWRQILHCVLTILASPPARVPVEFS
ncbi:MAG: 4'-phosphopantetheinyl transferase superfamily protein [Thermoanaerobaculia bacterium]